MSQYERMKERIRGMRRRGKWEKEWERERSRTHGAPDRLEQKFIYFLFFRWQGGQSQPRITSFPVIQLVREVSSTRQQSRQEENRTREWERERNAWGVNSHLGILLSLTSSPTCQKPGPMLYSCRIHAYPHGQILNVELMMRYFKCVWRFKKKKLRMMLSLNHGKKGEKVKMGLDKIHSFIHFIFLLLLFFLSFLFILTPHL